MPQLYPQPVSSTSGITIIQDGGGGFAPLNGSIRLAGSAGLWAKQSCRVATAAALPAYTYADNVITASANGALTVDGIAVAANDRVLLKDGAAGSDNGIYTVTQPGDGSNPFILTRTTDCDTSDNYISGVYTFIEIGTVNTTTVWIVTTQGLIVVGTTSVTWSEIVPWNTLSTVIIRDVVGSLPVAGLAGRLFFATDTQALYYDNGASWDLINISPQSYVFASLPTPTTGMMAVVTDSTVNTWGTAVTVGGGGDIVLTWFNGTNWTVIGA